MASRYTDWAIPADNCIVFGYVSSVVHREDGDVIAETCGSDRNCTVVYAACAYAGFINEIHV